MENRYEIRKPINNIEFIKGIKLEKKIFNNSSANYFLENIHFSNSIIIKDCLKNKIVGFLIHVNRYAIILNIKQKVSFVSSVCIHPDYRNKGLSKGLIKESLYQLKRNKVSIAFVIEASVTLYILYSVQISESLTNSQLPLLYSSIKNRISSFLSIEISFDFSNAA